MLQMSLSMEDALPSCHQPTDSKQKFMLRVCFHKTASGHQMELRVTSPIYVAGVRRSIVTAF